MRARVGGGDAHIDAGPAVIAQHGAYGGGAVEEAHVALAAAVRAEAALRVLVRVRVRVRVTVRVRVRLRVSAVRAEALQHEAHQP